MPTTMSVRIGAASTPIAGSAEIEHRERGQAHHRDDADELGDLARDVRRPVDVQRGQRHHRDERRQVKQREDHRAAHVLPLARRVAVDQERGEHHARGDRGDRARAC